MVGSPWENSRYPGCWEENPWGPGWLSLTLGKIQGQYFGFLAEPLPSLENNPGGRSRHGSRTPWGPHGAHGVANAARWEPMGYLRSQFLADLSCPLDLT